MSIYTSVVPPFGENLKRIRQANKLTQAQVAAAMGIHQGQFSNIESGDSGNPTLPTLVAVARALKCSVDDLLVGVDGDYDAAMIARREQNLLLRKLAVLVLAAKNYATSAGLPRTTIQDVLSLANRIANLDEAVASGNVPDDATDAHAAANADLTEAAGRLGLAKAPTVEEAQLLSMWRRLLEGDRRVLRQNIELVYAARIQGDLSFESGEPVTAPPTDAPETSQQGSEDRRRKAARRAR